MTPDDHGRRRPQRKLRKMTAKMREQAVSATHAASMAAPARSAPSHRNGFIIATVGALLMTVTGALNTDGIGFWPRLAYWLILMELGALIGVGVSVGIQQWGRLRDQRIAEGALTAVLIALPLSLVVTGASMLFFGMPIPSLPSLLSLFGIVVFFSGIVTAINYAVHASPASSERLAVAAALPDPSARFAERLPLHLRECKILALEAEDHYLRVHSELGSALILMRLSDAIAELEQTAGAQTHRSWWVARSALRQARRGDGRATLVLTNGVAVPVSRSYYKALNDAGWLN